MRATTVVGSTGCFRASGGMADALASGASVLRDVGVQVPLRPQCDESGHGPHHRSQIPRPGLLECASSYGPVDVGSAADRETLPPRLPCAAGVINWTNRQANEK